MPSTAENNSVHSHQRCNAVVDMTIIKREAGVPKFGGRFRCVIALDYRMIFEDSRLVVRVFFQATIQDTETAIEFEDGVTEFVITKAIAEKYREITDDSFVNGLNVFIISFKQTLKVFLQFTTSEGEDIFKSYMEQISNTNDESNNGDYSTLQTRTRKKSTSWFRSLRGGSNKKNLTAQELFAGAEINPEQSTKDNDYIDYRFFCETALIIIDKENKKIRKEAIQKDREIEELKAKLKNNQRAFSAMMNMCKQASEPARVHIESETESFFSDSTDT